MEVLLKNVVMRPRDADEMTNSIETDQEESDLGLHHLLRPVRKLRSLVYALGPGFEFRLRQRSF